LDLQISRKSGKIAGQKDLPCFNITPSLHSGGSMSHKLVMILSALGVSSAILSGCVDESGYLYSNARVPTAYSERVVVARRHYDVRQEVSYYHRGKPRVFYVQSGDRRSPRCFGTNCYVGATFREDPYYQLGY
jgi:hypothetical protein